MDEWPRGARNECQAASLARDDSAQTRALTWRRAQSVAVGIKHDQPDLNMFQL